MQEKNIKEVIINAEEKVKLNFTDILLIVTTFGVMFFVGMFSTAMSNWQIFLTSILLCYSIHCNIMVLNNKLVQEYYNSLLNKKKKLDEEKNKLLNNIENLKNKGKDNIISKLQLSLEKNNNDLLKLKTSINIYKNELDIMNNYYNNNLTYLTNLAIITGIRNSISHGHVETILGKDFSSSKIIFKDIYEGEITFELTVTLQDFLDFLDSSFQEVINFIKPKENMHKK